MHQLRKLDSVDRLYSKGRGCGQVQIPVGRLRSLRQMKTFPFQDHFMCVDAPKTVHPFQGLPSRCGGVWLPDGGGVLCPTPLRSPAAQRRSVR